MKFAKRVPVTHFFLSGILISCLGVSDTKLSQAQSITSESAPTPGSTGTTVTPIGNRFDIGGGRLSGDGKNLFHSFTNFGLQQNQIANFLSQPAIQNILGRINSGNASVINGIIRVSGGNANLYLMNPAGIVFGANATLNVPAAFTATTANGIGFGTNGWFSVGGTNNYDSLVGTPSSLAFTMTQPGAIVNAANLATQQGQNLTLVAGTVASTGQLSAPGGNITVATLPGTSMLRLSQPGSVLSLDIRSISPGESQPTAWTLPVLSLAELLTGPGVGSATGLTVNPDGTVQLTGSGIRVENGDVVAGNIDTSIVSSTPSTSTTLTHAGSILLWAERSINTTTGTLSSASNAGNGGFVSLHAQNDITVNSINTQGGFTITGYGLPTVTANGGTISLTSQKGNIVTGTLDSHASGNYEYLNGWTNGGMITLIAKQGNIATGNLDSHAASGNTANGGQIVITAQNGNIVTGTLDSHASAAGGNGGAIVLSTQKGNIATNSLLSYANGEYVATGGTIALNAQNSITTGTLDSHASAELDPNGGSIALTTQNGHITTGTLDSHAVAGYGGGTAGAIALTTKNGNITTGTLDSHSSGRIGPGGAAITVTTQNGNIATGNLYSYSSSSRGGYGAAITLTAQNGDITTGDLNSFSNGVYFGDGGAITVTAGNSITSGKINSSSSYGALSSTPVSAGSVTFYAPKNIAVSSINAQGGSNGTGGRVSVLTNGLIRISDSFTAADGVTTASISTQGGTGGGKIVILNGGGTQNPFKVGDATINGTAKDITSGAYLIPNGTYRISSTPVFTVPSPTYTQGDIKIITLP